MIILVTENDVESHPLEKLPFIGIWKAQIIDGGCGILVSCRTWGVEIKMAQTS